MASRHNGHEIQAAPYFFSEHLHKDLKNNLSFVLRIIKTIRINSPDKFFKEIFAKHPLLEDIEAFQAHQIRRIKKILTSTKKTYTPIEYISILPHIAYNNE